MSSQWMNKYAVMRDLSMIQGLVPANIDDTFNSGDKPPTLNITEETEEELFKNCTGDGDVGAPDLGLIKQMLDMVRSQDASSDPEDETVIQISKLNPTAKEFQPTDIKQKTQSKTENPSESAKTKGKIIAKNKEHRSNRNVAVTSLLAMVKEVDKVETKKENSPKLLKPTDININHTDAVDKVNGWLKAQEKHLAKKNKEIISIDPSSMFKKKIISPPAPVKNEPCVTKVKNEFSHYVPTSCADEYYKKYMERKRVRDLVQEDVWSRAERQMKEIDARRKLEAELFSQSTQAGQSSSSGVTTSPGETVSPGESSSTGEFVSPEESTNPENSESPSYIKSSHQEKSIEYVDELISELSSQEEQKLQIVRLPKHRHLISKHCVVCETRRAEKKTIHVIDADGEPTQWRNELALWQKTEADSESSQSALEKEEKTSILNQTYSIDSLESLSEPLGFLML